MRRSFTVVAVNSHLFIHPDLPANKNMCQKPSPTTNSKVYTLSNGVCRRLLCKADKYDKKT